MLPMGRISIFMAIGDIGLVASGATKTSGTTLALTNTSGATISSGTLLILAFAYDNPASTTKPTISFTTNNTGGTWTSIASAGSGVTTTAGSGIWTDAYYVYVTTDIDASATISTINWSVAVAAKAAAIEGFTGTAGGPTIAATTGTSTLGTPSAAQSVTSGNLAIGIAGHEANALPTRDSDTTNGTWDTMVGAFSTGATGGTNAAVGIQDKIVTATGTQTFNTSLSNDAVAIICQFAPAPIIAKSASDGAAITISDPAPTITIPPLLSSLSLDFSGPIDTNIWSGYQGSAPLPVVTSGQGVLWSGAVDASLQTKNIVMADSTSVQIITVPNPGNIDLFWNYVFSTIPVEYTSTNNTWTSSGTTVTAVTSVVHSAATTYWRGTFADTTYGGGDATSLQVEYSQDGTAWTTLTTMIYPHADYAQAGRLLSLQIVAATQQTSGGTKAVIDNINILPAATTPITASDTAAITITGNATVIDPSFAQITGTESIGLSISEIGQPSTIVDLGVIASAASSTPGTSLALVNSSGAAIPAGTLLVFSYMSDNPASVTAPTFSSTPIAGLGTINYFYTGPVGSGVTTTAGSGIWAWSFYCYTTASIAAGATIITTNWSTSVNTRAAMATGYTGVTGAPFSVASIADTKGAPSINTTIAAQAGDLVVGIIGAESATATGDMDIVGGQWKALQSVATATGGADNTNIIMGHQSKVPYSYNKQVYNPTSANDAVAFVGVFRAAYRHKTNTDATALRVSETASIIDTTASAPSISTDTSVMVVTETSSINVMGTVKTAIANRETKRANFALLGASITEGYPTTREKYITSYLDGYMRTTYPTSGNPQGLGYFGLSSIAVWQAGTAPYITYSGTGGVYDETTGRGGNHAVWSAPQSAPAGVYFSVGPEGPWTSFDINVITGPTGSATGGAVAIDGTVVYFSNYSDTTKLTKIPMNYAVTSSVQIGPGNSGTLDIIIDGVTAYQGDEAKGITAHAFGHGGYTAAKWLRNEVGHPSWIDDIIAEDPDLFIIDEIGPNDANAGLGSVEFKKQYGDLIDYIRASGYNKPILSMAFVDGSAGGGMAFIEPWQNYVDAIQQVAKQKGLGFLNLYGDIPNPPGSLYYSDNVHGATDGSLHAAIADRIMGKITDTSYDRAAITITETASVLDVTGSGSASPTATESEAITITETSSVSATTVASDTSAITVTDVSTSTSTLSAAESEALTIAESRTLVGSSTSTDTSAITIGDVSALAINVTPSASESEALTITESSSVAINTLSLGSDQAAITISEASAVAKSSGTTDTAAITIAETRTLTGSSTSTESAAVTITESSSIAVSFATSDVSTITITEDTSGNNTVVSTDELIIVVDDSASVVQDLALAASDSVAITITDTGTTFVVSHNQPHVFFNGLWQPGVVHLFHDGDWRTLPIYVFTNGIWT